MIKLAFVILLANWSKAAIGFIEMQHKNKPAVNNTKRVRSSRAAGVDTGNFVYAKIEAKSRKTDPFMALVASMVVEPVLGNGQTVSLPPVGAFIF